MKVRELVEELNGVDPELDVVICTTNDMGEVFAWNVTHTSRGWEPSGVFSIESNDENLVLF